MVHRRSFFLVLALLWQVSNACQSIDLQLDYDCQAADIGYKRSFLYPFLGKNAGVFGFDAGILGWVHRVSQIQLIVISHHISHHLGWFSWGDLE